MTDLPEPTEEQKDETRNILKAGREYAQVIKNFMDAHPELQEIVNNEHKYLTYDLTKAIGNVPSAVNFILSNPQFSQQLTYALGAAFIQGYYRCYERMILEKLIPEEKQP